MGLSLGIHLGHHASLALVQDGTLIAGQTIRTNNQNKKLRLSWFIKETRNKEFFRIFWIFNRTS